VDSTDTLRLDTVREELLQLTEFAPDVPILIFANKQDLLGPVGDSRLAEILRLAKLGTGNGWHVRECCAKTGDGLMESFEYFSTMVKAMRGKTNDSITYR